MKHICGELCHKIVEERARGVACPIVWNALSRQEQDEWLAAEHSWGIMNTLRRAMYAAKILIGRTE